MKLDIRNCEKSQYFTMLNADIEFSDYSKNSSIYYPEKSHVASIAEKSEKISLA